MKMQEIQQFANIYISHPFLQKKSNPLMSIVRLFQIITLMKDSSIEKVYWRLAFWNELDLKKLTLGIIKFF